MNHFILPVLFLFSWPLVASEMSSSRPLLQEFLGLNAHYHFKPELYQPVTRWVRTYHDMDWDVAAPGDPPTFPNCINGVNWDHVYGSWRDGGVATHLSVQFVKFGKHHPDHRSLWQGREAWAREYGRALAQHFGPTHGNGLVHSLEIGNEPGVLFDDGLYQRIFQEMAEGIREADPAIKIATCTVHVGPADEYHKSLDETFAHPSLAPLYDILNVHSYATLPSKFRRHPWDRTYPEDPRSDFLRAIEKVISWRDRNAPGKEIWVTEYGWDACTPAAMERREGWFEKLGWSGVSDQEQAEYLVRASLILSTMPIERAFLFWYNDEDEPSVHGSSGLTRNFEPKPSYWAMAQLQELAGSYRFHKMISQQTDRWIVSFVSDAGDELWIAWKTCKAERYLETTDLPAGRRILSARPMQTGETPPDELAPARRYALSTAVTYFQIGK